jgi:hypothetical protein
MISVIAVLSLGASIYLAGRRGSRTRLRPPPRDYRLNVSPPQNQDVDGFAVRPESLPPAERAEWRRIAPTSIVYEFGTPKLATDHWPFLYLKGQAHPGPHHPFDGSALRDRRRHGLSVLAQVRRRARRPHVLPGRGVHALETKAVVQLALVLGNTWIINSSIRWCFPASWS